MSTVVNIHEAKTHLSRLIEAVERGEEVVIARAGTPVVTLEKYVAPKRGKIRPPGGFPGTENWWMADDFNDPVDYLFEALSDAPDPLDSPSPAK